LPMPGTPTLSWPGRARTAAAYCSIVRKPDLGWVNTPCGAEMASVMGSNDDRSGADPGIGSASVAAKGSLASSSVEPPVAARGGGGEGAGRAAGRGGHDARPEPSGERRLDDAPERIDAAARRPRHDQADRVRRIVFAGVGGERRRRGRRGEDLGEATTREHG